MSQGRYVLRCAALLLPFALAACGGGGGGGGAAGGGAGLPTPDPLAAEQPASNFSDDPEFDPCYTDGITVWCVYGLGQIGAQFAYAKGAYGGGVVVAVIDSGIDTTHPELDGNISPQSTDIVTGAALVDEDGHGTFVAGIIAAERNGLELHGVAFDATILAIRADTQETDAATCAPDPAPCTIFLLSDVQAAIDYAAGRAHVINLSLGGAGAAWRGYRAGADQRHGGAGHCRRRHRQ